MYCRPCVKALGSCGYTCWTLYVYTGTPGASGICESSTPGTKPMLISAAAANAQVFPTALSSPIHAGSSTALEHEPDVADDHRAIHRFYHVVNRQRRHGHGGQRFHLDA